MSLKKIIRESLESDWEWTKFEPIEPRKPGEVRVGDIYTIYGNNYHVRYILEIIDILENRIYYKILESPDEEDGDEPIGSIHSIGKNNAKNLIVDQGYWKLTQSNDMGFT